ncbi:MAG: DHH family phosphoesterase [Clostridia bacterium]|nr:DHH family phosphoesterase [Clostridia bacterium]
MSSKNNRFVKLRVPYASRLEIAICIALACLNIAILAVLCEFLRVSTVISALLVVLMYLAEVAVIGMNHKANLKFLPRKSIHRLLEEDGSVVIKNSLLPVVALDIRGTILWYNDSMRAIISSEETLVGENIDKIFSEEFDSETFTDMTVTVNGRLYKVEGFKISEEGEGLFLAMLTDITELSEAEKRYADERVVVAYIAIDNVEDVLQYVHEQSRDAVSVVDDKLKSWAASINGVIKSYDNDKYVMFFDSQYLDECIKNRFAILDSIRDTRVGDSVSLTVSIGVSRIKGSLRERELAARDAIDMALQRGGDQAVYKTETTTEYFGGRTKSVYKRSNVRSRTFTNQLTAFIARADNVIIMGHRYGDFDSFGAAVGVARLCMLCGVKANIAIDLRDKNLGPCIEMMQETELYSQTFVDNADGLELVGPDTLVILVDHNALERAQFSDIAKKVKTVAIIDHHRKIDKLPEAVKLSYIEPSASSSCELVAEMLENAISSQNLIKEVADMLLSGILLDTKQFTRSTGTRTFGAAQYLRGAGASPTDVYNLFKTSAEDLSKEARFHTSIITYKDNIAISACDGDTDESYRVIASKAADKMLTLRGIDAAFTLVRIGEQIHISGRSNGKVNVQLILEKFHGGGHFDVAGAQVISDSVTDVLETLKVGIDDYFEQ